MGNLRLLRARDKAKIRITMALDDTPVWTLVTRTGQRVECMMRFAPGGVELAITVDGEPAGSWICSTGTEAFACAEDERERWEEGTEW
jgi:hypothetical protein